MKLLLIGLLAIISIAESRLCEPNESFADYCNTCECTEDGEDADCTQLFCDRKVWNKDGTLKGVNPFHPRRKICEPGAMFKEYCNTCICARNGKDKACTLMDCDLTVWNKDGTRKSVSTKKPRRKRFEHVCEPGTTFKDYCNACKCSDDGKTAACTLMDCDRRVYNKDGTLKSRASEPVKAGKNGLYCKPSTRFEESCDDCRCSDDGKSALCSYIPGCDPTTWNEDGTRKFGLKSGQICRPSTKFNDRCNDCRCSPDGTDAVCTRVACLPDSWTKYVQY